MGRCTEHARDGFLAQMRLAFPPSRRAAMDSCLSHCFLMRGLDVGVSAAAMTASASPPRASICVVLLSEHLASRRFNCVE